MFGAMQTAVIFGCGMEADAGLIPKKNGHEFLNRDFFSKSGKVRLVRDGESYLVKEMRLGAAEARARGRIRSRPGGMRVDGVHGRLYQCLEEGFAPRLCDARRIRVSHFCNRHRLHVKAGLRTSDVAPGTSPL